MWLRSEWPFWLQQSTFCHNINLNYIPVNLLRNRSVEQGQRLPPCRQVLYRTIEVMLRWTLNKLHSAFRSARFPAAPSSIIAKFIRPADAQLAIASQTQPHTFRPQQLSRHGQYVTIHDPYRIVRFCQVEN